MTTRMTARRVRRREWTDKRREDAEKSKTIAVVLFCIIVQFIWFFLSIANFTIQSSRPNGLFLD
jgi:hypothetical protein